MSKPILEVDGKRYEVVEIAPPAHGELFLSSQDLSVKACKQDVFRGDRPILKEIRWRAEPGGIYFYIDDFGAVEENDEDGHGVDSLYHKCGNYFRSEAEAKESAIYKAYIRD